MTVNYGKIIATAARVTANTPLLWFFGLFLSAGFNSNWLYLSRAGFIASTGQFFDRAFLHRGSEAGMGIFLVLLAIVGIVLLVLSWLVVNWVKAVFVLNVADVLEVERLGVKPDLHLSIWQQQKFLFRQSKKTLSAVIALSLFTIVAQAVVATVLLGPRLWAIRYEPLPGIMPLAAVLLILFVLFFSVLNYFAVLFAVLYQKSFTDAFAASAHFIKSKAGPLFLVCLMLLAIYAAGVWLGVEVAAGLRYLINGATAQFGMFESAERHLAWYPGAIDFIFVLWLGLLNAFFNVGLFVFFKELVKPAKLEESVPASPNLMLNASVDKSA